MSQRISANTQLPANQDLNKVVIPGDYPGAAGGVINGPDNTIVSTYSLMVKQNSANTTSIWQEITFRANSAVRIFRRFCSNSTGTDPLGGSWTFGAWEEMPTPSGGFTTGQTVKAGRLESTGRVVSSISVESVTGTFTGNISCVALTQTSDETLKEDFIAVDASLIKAAKSVQAKQYRFIGDETGAWHIGFMAQDVVKAMEAEGLNPDEYSLVFKHTDEDTGRVSYSLNYTELLLLRSL